MLKARNASCTLTSSGTGTKSVRWSGSSMWKSQLAKKTTTAETRIGSHSDGIDTMPPPRESGLYSGPPHHLTAWAPPSREYGTSRFRHGDRILGPAPRFRSALIALVLGTGIAHAAPA